MASSVPASAGIFSRNSNSHESCSSEHRLSRAGNPQCIAPWARCGVNGHYTGYYVGGGAAIRGDYRYAHEGTWGLDYVPWYSRVELGWFHARRHQGGEGQYEPDHPNNPLRDFVRP